MKYPITIIFLLLSISIISQREIIYDLDSYKQVNFQRSELLLNPNGGLSGIDHVNVVDSNVDFHFKIGADAVHNKNINNQKEQFTISQSATANIAEGIELFLSRKTAKRSYHKNKYLKLGYDSEVSFDNRRSQPSNVKENFKNLEFVGDLGFGFGRIEYVNHAWSAVQILQALEDNDLLLRIPSHEEITLFADLVGTVRTDRILDFRLRNIEILETTINYLIEEKLIDQLSTRAILIISDTYQYDQIIQRNSGSRLEFTFAPGTRYISRNPEGSSSPTKLIRVYATGRIDHQSFKNMDVKWMQTRSYGAILQFSNNYRYYANNQLDMLTTKTADAGLTYTYGYRYLRSLRTNYKLTLSSQIFMNANIHDGNIIWFSAARLSATLLASFNHYFSPYTQISIYGSLRYLDEEFQAGKFQPKISGSANFTISQAIF